MKMKILSFSLISVFIMMALPSISAVEFNVVKETNGLLNGKIKDMDFRRAESALMRSMSRIKVAKKKTE